MKSFTQRVSGRAFSRVLQPASVLKSTLLGLGILAGASIGLAQPTVFNNGKVNSVIYPNTASWAGVFIGDTVGKTHLAILATNASATGMFRLGRGSYTSSAGTAVLTPAPDGCILTVGGGASLAITGSGHLCLGGVTGSGNEAIVTESSTLSTPKIHLGGMRAFNAATNPVTNANRVLIQGTGSSLTVTSDGNGDALFIGVTADEDDLNVYGNNLTITEGATATITGEIHITSLGSDNNIRIGYGSRLTWKNKSTSDIDALIAANKILFEKVASQTVYGPDGSPSEVTTSWLPELTAPGTVTVVTSGSDAYVEYN